MTNTTLFCISSVFYFQLNYHLPKECLETVAYKKGQIDGIDMFEIQMYIALVYIIFKIIQYLIQNVNIWTTTNKRLC